MKDRRGTPRNNFTPALEAIGNLLQQELNETLHGGELAAMSARDEIELRPIPQKTGAFYRHFLPLRKDLVALLADSYRRYFKLALAHPGQAGRDPNDWAWGQLRPAVGAAVEWIRDWYILACDGENQFVRHLASTEWVPGQTVSLSVPTTVPPFPSPKSWRAPAWLFQVAPTLGILLIRSEHVPERDSEQKLGAAHTRLLLKAARRSFQWELVAAIETVRNEEIAAAGAIPSATVSEQMEESKKRPKHWLKGVEGLTRKADLSRYMHNLTDKQRLAFSLRHEYQLGPTEIAWRMGIDRKTLSEHLDAANKKIEGDRSFERRRINRTKRSPEE
jgi:DNA-directed RNA polymerase specialized sigma24 family protein